MEQRDGAWGEIVIRVGRDAIGDFLEVEDTGCGMSARVLSGPLLDFGVSYWDSGLMREEWPGLLARGFEPRGRYGIGFFSVFMWGERVRVTTRRADEAQKDTIVLEFIEGAASRPLLRHCAAAERVRDGGTRVRLWLKSGASELEEVVLHRDGRAAARLSGLREICEWLCPALDVNLYVEQRDKGRQTVIEASDWLTMDGARLIERTCVGRGWSASGRLQAALAETMEEIADGDGEIAGRCSLAPFPRQIGDVSGVLCDDGLRIGDTPYIAGILRGVHAGVARGQGTPTVSRNHLLSWLGGQAMAWAALGGLLASQAQVASAIHACGVSPGPLAIGFGREGHVSAESLSQWVEAPDEVALITYQPRYGEASIYSFESEFKPEPHVIVLFTVFLRDDKEVFGNLPHRYNLREETEEAAQWERHGDRRRTLYGAAMEALSRRWQTPVGKVLLASTEEQEQHVGVMGGKAVIGPALVVRNPNRHAATG